VNLAVDDPSKGAAVGLDHPPRTQVVHGAGDQDRTQPEVLAGCRAWASSWVAQHTAEATRSERVQQRRDFPVPR
jgi:hypothetical protein